jgi:hypothetical protein
MISGIKPHLLTLALCKIVPCLEEQLLLHATSLSKHATPNRIDDDNVHQSLKYNIHLSSCVAREKVRNSLLQIAKLTLIGLAQYLALPNIMGRCLIIPEYRNVSVFDSPIAELATRKPLTFWNGP